MALYDSFIDTMAAHPPFVQKMEQKRNQRVAKIIDKFVYIPVPPRRSVVEIGIGLGLFKDAVTALGYSYTGIDRNQKMVDAINNLNDGSTAVCAEMPPIPQELNSAKFDVAYAAFVAEHFADGLELLKFVEALKEILDANGLLVLLCPDTRSMGIEFWNQDYTHRYPTTERNVSMIVKEAGYKIEKIIHYRGAMWTNLKFWLVWFCGLFFSYRWMGRLFGHKALFYSIYQYIKIDTLFFICRK